MAICQYSCVYVWASIWNVQAAVLMGSYWLHCRKVFSSAVKYVWSDAKTSPNNQIKRNRSNTWHYHQGIKHSNESTIWMNAFPLQYSLGPLIHEFFVKLINKLDTQLESRVHHTFTWQIDKVRLPPLLKYLRYKVIKYEVKRCILPNELMQTQHLASTAWCRKISTQIPFCSSEIRER